MNEDITPTTGGATPGAPSGHEIPQTFSSPAPSAPQSFPAPYGSVPPTPNTAGFAPGAAFGVPASTTPLDGSAGGAAALPAPKEHRVGASKVAAIIVAAALVGGIAGFGGSYLGSTVWQQPVSSSAQGPNAVTINNPDDVNATTAVATKVLPSVVTIEVSGSNAAGSGSGSILTADGYVLTNTHVVTLGGEVADPTIRVTTSDGHIYSATVVGTDPIYDLAVIKLKDASGLTPIEFGDSSDLNVGESSIAIGAPLGLANSVTTGIVSALDRSIQIASSALPDSADQDSPRGDGSGQGGPFQFDLPGQIPQQSASESISISVIQTDAAINPGNSGGALVDADGRLIGVNVAIATAGGQSGGGQESGSIGVGFAIPSNIAKRVSDEIIADGKATHGLLGASVQDASLSASADVAGAAIVDIVPDGAARDAGLRVGDIVTAFDGAPVTGATDLTAQVRAAAAGSSATVTYVRDGKTYEVDVTLGELAL